MRIILGDWAGRTGTVVAPPSSGPVWGKVFVKIDDVPRPRPVSSGHIAPGFRPRKVRWF